MAAIADTDVLIDFLAGREPAAGRIALELEAGGLRTTAVTRVELLAGARSARQEGKVRALLDSMPALPLDEPAADRAAKVKRDLDGAGLSIGAGVRKRIRNGTCSATQKMVARGRRRLCETRAVVHR